MLAVGIPAAPAATAPPAASAAPLSGEGGFASLIAEGEALAAEEGAAQSVDTAGTDDALAEAAAVTGEGEDAPLPTLDAAPVPAPFVLSPVLLPDQPRVMTDAAGAEGEDADVLVGAPPSAPPAEVAAVVQGALPHADALPADIGAASATPDLQAAPQPLAPAFTEQAPEPVAVAERAAPTPLAARPDPLKSLPETLTPPTSPASPAQGEAVATTAQGAVTQASPDETPAPEAAPQDTTVLPAERRKMARSARLTVDRVTTAQPREVPEATAAPREGADGADRTAPQGARPVAVAPDPVAGQGEPPSAPPAKGADSAPNQAGPATAGEGPLPQSLADKPAPAVQSFEAHLAKAAEPPAPPRSPLVQAAVDRLAPLPAAVGETVVRLNPHGLGLIEVVINEGRNGALDVALRVQNPLVLEAMRQERDAVAVVFAAPQGGADGSLSMDLMQSGARQGGGGSDPRGQPRQSGHPAPEAAAEVAADLPERQILSTDRVNIVT